VSENILQLVNEQLLAEIEKGSDVVNLLANFFKIELGELSPAPLSGSLWTYQLVVDSGLREIIDNPSNYSFNEGIEHLVQKEYFVANKIPGFDADPLAMFSIAISLKLRNFESKYSDWLINIIGTAETKEHDPWRKSLLKASKMVLDESYEFDDSTILKVSLAVVGLGNASLEEYESAKSICLRLENNEPEKALFKLVSLRAIFELAGRIQIGSTNVEDVSTLLSGVEPGLRRWVFEDKARTSNSTKQQWDIQNEYHVQSLLWSMLRPVFPDLKDEEYLKSIGYKHPRVDLALPSLRTIIEVKFLRKSTQYSLAKITEEIAADASLYMVGKDYDQMIVFIWDNSASAQHHQSLIDGLKEISGIKDVIMVSRPGSWKLTPS